jgi:hypothetical protein
MYLAFASNAYISADRARLRDKAILGTLLSDVSGLHTAEARESGNEEWRTKHISVVMHGHEHSHLSSLTHAKSLQRPSSDGSTVNYLALYLQGTAVHRPQGRLW